MSAAERLTGPPAQGDGGAVERLGQKAERSGGGRNYQGSATGRAKSCRIARRSLHEGKRNPVSLGDKGELPGLAVMARASMLRGADRAKAGSQRLHGQSDFGAECESEPFEASSFKGNQTAQSRRRGPSLRLHCVRVAFPIPGTVGVRHPAQL